MTPAGDPHSGDPLPQARRWFGIGSGVYAIGGAVVCGLLAWVVLRLLAPVATDPPYPPEEIPASVRWWMRHRWLMPVLAAPALAIGVVMVRTPRRVVVLVVASTLAMLVPFGVAMYCFFRLMAPMYEYRAL